MVSKVPPWPGANWVGEIKNGDIWYVWHNLVLRGVALVNQPTWPTRIKAGRCLKVDRPTTEYHYTGTGRPPSTEGNIYTITFRGPGWEKKQDYESRTAAFSMRELRAFQPFTRERTE